MKSSTDSSLSPIRKPKLEPAIETAIKAGFAEWQPGPNPSGSASSIAFFLDPNRAPVTKDRARHMEIHELDESGNIVARNYMNIGIEEPPDLTPEDEEILDRIHDRLSNDKPQR